MGIPQIIIIIFYTIALTMSLLRHGELSEYNFGFALIHVAIVISLLYWGGFFS